MKIVFEVTLQNQLTQTRRREWRRAIRKNWRKHHNFAIEKNSEKVTFNMVTEIMFRYFCFTYNKDIDNNSYSTHYMVAVSMMVFQASLFRTTPTDLYKQHPVSKIFKLWLLIVVNTKPKYLYDAQCKIFVTFFQKFTMILIMLLTWRSLDLYIKRWKWYSPHSR